MNDDPIVAEVRRIRDQLAARFNYDVEAFFADIRIREVEHGERLIQTLDSEQTRCRESVRNLSNDPSSTPPPPPSDVSHRGNG
jgi:hypothetical protein